jgi:cytochrome P450
MNNQPGNPAAGASVFNFFVGGDFAANPYPFFTQMRSMGPVARVPLSFGDGKRGAWMITRLEEAVQVLKDRRFTVDAHTVNQDGFFGRRAEGGGGLFGQSMISVDDPDHKRLRALVSRAFTPKYIADLRPRIQQLADELLDKVQPQGMMDLVHDYAYPLPINVISEMLGVPQKNRDQIREWSGAVGGDSEVRREERGRKARAFSAYTAQLVADKRQNPGDDLISQLIQIEEEGDRLSEGELLSMVGLLVFAGHETTSNLISIGTLALLDHPEQLEKLKADLNLVPSAVEELLRFSGPVTSPAPRFATEDSEIGGQHIQRGDLVLVVLASADRDETQFTDADELDIARSLNRHIAFGQGIHVCLGAPLARLEGEIAFKTLLQRMPNIRLNAPRESITWRGGFNLRGLRSLPVASQGHTLAFLNATSVGLLLLATARPMRPSL